MLNRFKELDRIKKVLLIISATTIPCYCLGMVLLWNAKGGRAADTPTPDLTITERLGGTPSVTFTSPVYTRTSTLTPTITQTFTTTITYMLPPSDTPSPSPSPTNTTTPTDTLVPTATDTVAPTDTETPTPTETTEPVIITP